MAAPTPRAKAPPYPRPVSPLNVEEVPMCPDTIVYEQWTDEAERETAERAAKRQKRIRDHADAYLRGDQIYIMTASLKGPFDKGWKNPWKTRRNIADMVVEVPETSARPTNHRSVRAVAAPETRPQRREVPQCDDLTYDIGDDIEFTQPPVVREKALTNIFQRTYDVPDLDRRHLTPVSARRIEDWLRTSDAYKTDRVPDVRSSPTPAYREYRLPTPDVFSQRPASAGGCNNNTQMGNWASRLSPKRDPEQSSLKHTAPESTQQTHESQHRAEAAILEQKSRSVHKIPPSTNLPAFEYKRAKRPKPAGEAPKLPTTSANGTHTMRIQADDAEDHLMPSSKPAVIVPEQPVKTSSKNPALSTETSKTTTANHLPSAQVVSAGPALEGLSNVQSTAELLQPVKPPTEQTTTQRQDSIPDDPQCTPAEAAVEMEDAELPCPPNHADIEGENTAASGTGREQTPARNLHTQALLGSIKPFAISTIKKIDITPLDARTPGTASKAPAKTRTSARAKKRKKASFAVDAVSDESQSSIKAGFQVRKQQANPSVPASTKIAIAEGLDDHENDDLDPPTPNPHADSLPSISDILKPTSFPVANKGKGTTQMPKSILKQRSQPAQQSSIPLGTTVTATGVSLPGANATYQSTTTSEKHDAQQPRQLDMFAIENSGGADSQAAELEQFDLDAVVADLGSYLGTWDVEKAAAQAGSG